MPEGPPMAWLVAVLCLYVLVASFVFGLTGTYPTSLIVVGVIVAVLAHVGIDAIGAIGVPSA